MKTTPFLLCFAIFLCSFASQDKTYKNYKNWIPEDFDSRKGVLIVEKFTNGDDRPRSIKACENATENMRAYMKEKYPYKFEFASRAEIKSNAKYADKATYRYILACTSGTLSPINGVGVSVESNDFHIEDRKLDKSYPDTGKASSLPMTTFKPVVNTIVMFLSEIKK